MSPIPAHSSDAHADRGFDRAADQPAGLGNAQVERAIDRVGELVIGGDGEEQVRRLHRDLVIAEVVVLEDADMVERAFDQRLGAGLAIFFEQVAFEAAGVDADADRAAIGLGGIDDFADALGRADIARVDAQAGGAGIGGFERALIMEMDVGDDRDGRGADDLLERGGAFDVGARDADEIDPGFLAAADLGDRRGGVRGRRVGHRLHRNGRIAADGDIADHDLAGLTALDRAPRTKGGHGAYIGAGGRAAKEKPRADSSRTADHAKRTAEDEGGVPMAELARLSRTSRSAPARARRAGPAATLHGLPELQPPRRGDCATGFTTRSRSFAYPRGWSAG